MSQLLLFYRQPLMWATPFRSKPVKYCRAATADSISTVGSCFIEIAVGVIVTVDFQSSGSSKLVISFRPRKNPSHTRTVLARWDPRAFHALFSSL